ncbi:hypothetical protein HMI48_10105 [Acidithiobacillus ferrooxidans]|uniref:hypothetical protein n=1 Tax=Acidithiobacillus ferrooxidans TaxID=920 RepID=UPI001C06C315|nr:hypothetical protein [Acidithiobacillus ferrooxidans]MBU2774216.1 hypothetical protein [Acidithiobacillus ferrooxidans]
MKIHHAKPVIAALLAVSLAGCVTAPTVMPHAESAQYPNLHRALENTSIVDHWKSCSGSFGSYYPECQTEFIKQSVGPAPLLVAKVGSKHRPTSMRSLNALMDIGGLFVGSVVPDFAGGSRTDLSGLHRFQSGNYFYAVRFEPTKAAAESALPGAAMLEARVPARFGGAVVGHTSYQFEGTTWEPYERRWVTGSGSFGVFYKAKPKANDAATRPFAVWDTKLKPLMKAYALTDQWQWAAGTTEKEQLIKIKTISAPYPEWTFVMVENSGTPLICAAGLCHTGQVNYPALKGGA